MRAIWRGSISFGLVSIPVTLLSASQANEIKFNLLDSEDSARIRYVRINEDTGEEVPWERIVKGYEYESGKYVLLKDEDFGKVKAEGTKTIDIDAFVDQAEIEPMFFETPYYLMPAKGSEKPYVLLRQILSESGKVGIARVVIRTKESLAAVYAHENALILNLLRFEEEIRPVEDFDLPQEAKISAKEVTLAKQLLESMTEKWSPKQYHDEYASKLKAWVEEKVKSGDTSTAPSEGPEAPAATKAEDIMEMLLKSLKGHGSSGDEKKPEPAKAKSGTAKAKAKAT